MKKYIVRLNGKEYEVEIEEVTRDENDRLLTDAPSTGAAGAGAGVSAGAGAATSSAAPAATQASAGTAQGIGQGVVVKAPMPGSINDVRVKPGDKVAKGDVLLILEAMKMMNEIVSPQAGTVTGLAVAKGDAVSTGDEMVSIG